MQPLDEIHASNARGSPWYISYRLSYRDLVAMMAERGINMSHTTILRWVIRYVPEFEKRWNRWSRGVNSSWRVDETYISVRDKWHYLYRAVESRTGHPRL
jgi:transposase-like protein